jgi:hypothetical protein
MLKVYTAGSKWKQNELIRQLEKKGEKAIGFCFASTFDRPRKAPPVVVDRTVQNVVDRSTPATLFVAPLVAPFQRAYILAMPQPQSSMMAPSDDTENACYYEPD